uniref:EF-hand and coiled-coil domain-containing protein 1-like n=1 Tax=Myxine glutinosa TaxID=7769 RepID=UPI00358F3183
MFLRNGGCEVEPQDRLRRPPSFLLQHHFLMTHGEHPWSTGLEQFLHEVFEQLDVEGRGTMTTEDFRSLCVLLGLVRESDVTRSPAGSTKPAILRDLPNELPLETFYKRLKVHLAVPGRSCPATPRPSFLRDGQDGHSERPAHRSTLAPRRRHKAVSFDLSDRHSCPPSFPRPGRPILKRHGSDRGSSVGPLETETSGVLHDLLRDVRSALMTSEARHLALLVVLHRQGVCIIPVGHVGSEVKTLRTGIHRMLQRYGDAAHRAVAAKRALLQATVEVRRLEDLALRSIKLQQRVTHLETKLQGLGLGSDGSDCSAEGDELHKGVEKRQDDIRSNETVVDQCNSCVGEEGKVEGCHAIEHIFMNSSNDSNRVKVEESRWDDMRLSVNLHNEVPLVEDKDLEETIHVKLAQSLTFLEAEISNSAADRQQMMLLNLRSNHDKTVPKIDPVQGMFNKEDSNDELSSRSKYKSYNTRTLEDLDKDHSNRPQGLNSECQISQRKEDQSKENCNLDVLQTELAQARTNIEDLKSDLSQTKSEASKLMNELQELEAERVRLALLEEKMFYALQLLQEVRQQDTAFQEFCQDFNDLTNASRNSWAEPCCQARFLDALLKNLLSARSKIITALQ